MAIRDPRVLLFTFGPQIWWYVRSPKLAAAPDCGAIPSDTWRNYNLIVQGSFGVYAQPMRDDVFIDSPIGWAHTQKDAWL